MSFAHFFFFLATTVTKVLCLHPQESSLIFLNLLSSLFWRVVTCPKLWNNDNMQNWTLGPLEFLPSLLLKPTSATLVQSLGLARWGLSETAELLCWGVMAVLNEAWPLWKEWWWERWENSWNQKQAVETLGAGGHANSHNGGLGGYLHWAQHLCFFFFFSSLFWWKHSWFTVSCLFQVCTGFTAWPCTFLILTWPTSDSSYFHLKTPLQG